MRITHEPTQKVVKEKGVAIHHSSMIIVENHYCVFGVVVTLDQFLIHPFKIFTRVIVIQSALHNSTCFICTDIPIILAFHLYHYRLRYSGQQAFSVDQRLPVQQLVSSTSTWGYHIFRAYSLLRMYIYQNGYVGALSRLVIRFSEAYSLEASQTQSCFRCKVAQRALLLSMFQYVSSYRFRCL